MLADSSNVLCISRPSNSAFIKRNYARTPLMRYVHALILGEKVSSVLL